MPPTISTDTPSALDAALLRTVSDRIVPPDDHTPGASESGAYDYLVRQLSPGGDLTGQQENYHAALLAISELSQKQHHGAAFVDLPSDAQDDVLRAFEKQNPRFFARMVEHVQESFYITKAAWDMIGWKVTA